MTSKGDSLKTNEFLRLRKLRLQQVREQSKDIAKKIRQRANVEQLRQVTNIQSNKEKEFLQQQEKLVNRLEQLYSRSLQNVGAGHKNASEVNEREIPVKVDLSKSRGREAAVALKKRRQEKLDEQKKLLDRKLQAREVANVLSREKVATVANALIKFSSGKSISNEENGKIRNANENVVNDNIEPQQDKPDLVAKNDMGTQWEFDEIPNEWEPNIPKLPIPNDDSVKNSVDDNVERSEQSRRNRRLNLFALSDEMPSSLRGGVTSLPDERLPIKPSLTLVSEYLQNRGLRLREPDTVQLQKKNSDDLQSIKQTLIRTRASRTDGSVFPNICHVLDEQVIPVPPWRAERNCQFCSNAYIPPSYRNISNNNNSINKASVLKSGCPQFCLTYENPKRCPKHHKCRHGLKIPVSGKSNVEHSVNSDETNRGLSKKNSVTMYDHSTRDTRDLPHNVEKLVVRDQSNDDDAYSQALKEASVIDRGAKTHHTVQQEARNRLAVTRQNVDKEYRDTLAFLNSLPKEKPARCIRTAYMDGNREQELKDKRQHKLQEEYRKIEKQNNKHHCKHVRNKFATREQNRSKSKSPVETDIDNNIVNKEFHYSWLPIPESDGSLAIHSIPNNVKDNRPGNTVKFSSVDTYHEYRSRHKHTPPTKDVDNESNKQVVETVIIQENSNDSEDSSVATDTSSVDNLQVRQNDTPSHKKDKQLDNAERIIIYKVMEKKKTKNKKYKRKSKSHNVNDTENSGARNNTGTRHGNAQNVTNKNDTDNIKTNTVSFTHLQEGIYKSVSANGDNITSLYFSDDQKVGKPNQNNKNTSIPKEDDNCTKTATSTENGESCSNKKPNQCKHCKRTSLNKYTDYRASAATSTSSFKTAVNDKTNNTLLDDGFIKVVGEGGEDARKFYVGASGFLKDDAYEVIIQLRKKEAEKISNSISQDINNAQTKTSAKDSSEENVLENPAMNEPINTSKNQTEQDGQIIPPQEIPQKYSPQNKNEARDQITVPNKEIAPPKEINVDSRQDEPVVKRPEINDKGISTVYRNSFAIPDNIPKSDTITRPVNSIYTQTTQTSPIPRPYLMHLSSSTSTTYMSPPELILPRYLRKGSSESCDDVYEPISSNFNSHKKRPTRYKVCRCGKCMKGGTETKADTPPNTTRSTDQTTDNLVVEEEIKKCTCRPKTGAIYKCKHRSDPKICSKQKFKRSSSENKRFYSGSSYSNPSTKRSKITNNFDKLNINPIIENYVKKLLALNKEGLKAIEVVNQECSAVNTPGSSVIDVPSNITNTKAMVCNKISLEQIKNGLEEQIMKNIRQRKFMSKSILKSTGSQTEKNMKLLYKSNKKRSVHKVKSFNISKQMLKTNKENRRQSAQSTIISTSTCSPNRKKEKTYNICSNIKKRNPQDEKSPTSRKNNINQETSNNTSYSETSKGSRKNYKSENKIKASKTVTKINTTNKYYQPKVEIRQKYPFPTHKSTTRSQSSESEASNDIRRHRNLSTPPISISTQTNQVDSEIEFMKLAENKLQNMEKIADLTEKCTKRLSNLAKVLEEVRRNKTLAYSQISTSECTSDSDQRSNKNIQTSNSRRKAFNPIVENQSFTEACRSMPTGYQEQQNNDVNKVPTYIPILKDLPKPDTFKTPSPLSFSSETNNADVQIVMDQQVGKNRRKPPPALNRINLKNVPEGIVIPHELSTVVEVDSPMSLKIKSHTTQIDNKHDVTSPENIDDINLNKMDSARIILDNSNKPVESNDLISNFNTSKKRHETQSTDTSEDSRKDPKLKMMDLKHFNEIMLKPFISLNDYAKQCNLDELEGQTSINGISKDENFNEELSSLHSETSIPDVMAELLKRNLISEPFKFETTSNVNSTTLSSESTLSLLAMSRARKDKKKSTMLVKNKENLGETSVSLSISSNPDLEHAFQRLGMGWASSTLKKTKERLALSSSSNTSSSSIPQFKMKSFNYQDIPELSSLLNITNKEEKSKPQEENINDIPKNALQQTSLINSMTVKEFLTNELANKITFSNRTNRNATEEFISLCETKIPDEMKLSQKPDIDEKSGESLPSGTNVRARTSTPVQIFKSMAYHSTSSSNTSNGLFSNADDLSSVKGTSNSLKHHSTSDKDDLTIPNYSLKLRKETTECSKSD